MNVLNSVFYVYLFCADLLGRISNSTPEHPDGKSYDMCFVEKDGSGICLDAAAGNAEFRKAVKSTLMDIFDNREQHLSLLEKLKDYKVSDDSDLSRRDLSSSMKRFIGTRFCYLNEAEAKEERGGASIELSKEELRALLSVVSNASVINKIVPSGGLMRKSFLGALRKRGKGDTRPFPTTHVFLNSFVFLDAWVNDYSSSTKKKDRPARLFVEQCLKESFEECLVQMEKVYGEKGALTLHLLKVDELK
jgi:hypothetical protein